MEHPVNNLIFLKQRLQSRSEVSVYNSPLLCEKIAHIECGCQPSKTKSFEFLGDLIDISCTSIMST